MSSKRKRTSSLSPVWSLEGNEGDSLFLIIVFRLLLEICWNVLVVVVCRLFPFIGNWPSPMSGMVSVLSFLKLLVKIICNRAELFSTSRTNKKYGEINKFFDRISFSDGILRLEINARIDGERLSIGQIKLRTSWFREESISSGSIVLFGAETGERKATKRFVRLDLSLFVVAGGGKTTLVEYLAEINDEKRRWSKKGWSRGVVVQEIIFIWSIWVKRVILPIYSVVRNRSIPFSSSNRSLSREFTFENKSKCVFHRSFLWLNIDLQKSIQSKRNKEAVKSIFQPTKKSFSLRKQLIILRQSVKINSKSALLFRFVEVRQRGFLRPQTFSLSVFSRISLLFFKRREMASGFSRMKSIWPRHKLFNCAVELSKVTEERCGWLNEGQTHSSALVFSPLHKTNKRSFDMRTSVCSAAWIPRWGRRQKRYSHQHSKSRPVDSNVVSSLIWKVRRSIRFTEFYLDCRWTRRSRIEEKYLSQTNSPREDIERIITFYLDIQTRVKRFLFTSSSRTNNRICIPSSSRSQDRLSSFDCETLSRFPSWATTLCRALLEVNLVLWLRERRREKDILFVGTLVEFLQSIRSVVYFSHQGQKLIQQIIWRTWETRDRSSSIFSRRLEGKPTIFKISQMKIEGDQARKYLEMTSYFVHQRWLLDSGDISCPLPPFSRLFSLSWFEISASVVSCCLVLSCLCGIKSWSWVRTRPNPNSDKPFDEKTKVKIFTSTTVDENLRHIIRVRLSSKF